MSRMIAGPGSNCRTASDPLEGGPEVGDHLYLRIKCGGFEMWHAHSGIGHLSIRKNHRTTAGYCAIGKRKHCAILIRLYPLGL